MTEPKLAVNSASNTMTQSYRATTYQLLEEHTNMTLIAKIINISLIMLIITNVIATIFESESSYHQQYLVEFTVFELISLTIFCIEYGLRVWCCVEAKKYQNLSPSKARIKYIRSGVALIDLITILPFILALFFNIDLRSLRLIRVLRLLKLTHYFKGFNIFISVIAKELKSITAAMLVMVFIITIAASLMHIIEGRVQPETFGSILKSLWWSVVTMTTVGYGDVVPVTPIGKLIATIIMLIGVGLVALPAGMLAARFGEELRERKEDLDSKIKQALADGYIGQEEYQELVELADRLEIDPEDFQRTIAQFKRINNHEKCPHCGK
ncbi:ion transporter [Colwellia ponticola]|uniref:Ion transporter n=1 Tax=Colwellia ponticola TaxID=2304625 RepID=A0A8H2PJI4_9GAMM|nr:ion transporter [Colwellia ponticola]TMM41922.1 ion transporter [Colwellia ponticola]